VLFFCRKYLFCALIVWQVNYETWISQECFCCDQKARAACAQSITLWQQATIEITRHDHSIVACSRHWYTGVILRAHSVRGEQRIQCNANREVATLQALPIFQHTRQRKIQILFFGFSSVYLCIPTKHTILNQECRGRKRRPWLSFSHCLHNFMQNNKIQMKHHSEKQINAKCH